MRTYPVDIFLPAAGFGERLRPATNHLPKPLLPILGTPLIEGILTRLAPVCDGRIGINLHWKPDLLRAWASASPWRERIDFFPENPILGTGGALKNAASLLSRRSFIVHNSDILLDIDFSRLIEEHLSAGNIATLVCHRLPHLSNVVVDERGRRTGVATALIEAAAGWLRDHGAPRVMLWTAEQNDGAQRLFEHLGFRRTMVEMTREL